MKINFVIAGLTALLLPLAVYGADAAKEPAKPSTTEKVKENVSDAIITAKVKTEFAKDKDVSAMHINVDTDAKGVVTLRGIAKTQAEADKAVQIAKNTSGVTAVKSELTVASSATPSNAATPAASTQPPKSTKTTKSTKKSDEPIDDTVITTRVKARLATEKNVHSADIHVTTVNGVVDLTGTARSKSEISRAVAVTRKVPNVKSVNNQLHVAAAPAKAAETAKMGDERQTNPGKSMAEINTEKPKAAASTSTTKSASAGKSDQPIDDTVITTKVKARMATDKQVEAMNIHVKTVNGVVELSGTAKNKAEADKAASLARGVDNVKSVKNEIRVQ